MTCTARALVHTNRQHPGWWFPAVRLRCSRYGISSTVRVWPGPVGVPYRLWSMAARAAVEAAVRAATCPYCMLPPGAWTPAVAQRWGGEWSVPRASRSHPPH